jgi:hypothetical protein
VDDDELELDLGSALEWFQEELAPGYALVHVGDEPAQTWPEALSAAVRRCYVSDEKLSEAARSTGLAEEDLIAAKLPSPGSTMAGDFGEILVYVYQAAKAQPDRAIGALKWRLKQDRTKPAPHADVVQFLVPHWPTPSDQDVILCSEVKTKSGPGGFSPIPDAIADSLKNRTDRLLRTLVWLRERAQYEPIGDVSLAHLDRFIQLTDHPPVTKVLRAVAVICTSILANELASAPTNATEGCQVVVIAVPDLRNTYMAVFTKAAGAVVGTPGGGNP